MGKKYRRWSNLDEYGFKRHWLTGVVWVNNCSQVLATLFKSFNGQPQNGFAKLQWETDNETASIVYEVERSEDRIHFYKIASIAGTGSGSYLFIDPVALNDQSYY